MIRIMKIGWIDDLGGIFSFLLNNREIKFVNIKRLKVHGFQGLN
jgi:hypothetical protein